MDIQKITIRFCYRGDNGITVPFLSICLYRFTFSRSCVQVPIFDLRNSWFSWCSRQGSLSLCVKKITVQSWWYFTEASKFFSFKTGMATRQSGGSNNSTPQIQKMMYKLKVNVTANFKCCVLPIANGCTFKIIHSMYLGPSDLFNAIS